MDWQKKKKKEGKFARSSVGQVIIRAEKVIKCMANRRRNALKLALRAALAPFLNSKRYDLSLKQSAKPRH
jgi:hypothetical protein